MYKRSAVLLIMATMAAGCGVEPRAPHTPEAVRELERSRWKQRWLVIVGDGAAQRQLFGDLGSAMEERDLRIMQPTPDEEPVLRERLGLPPEGFAVALLGKDGGVKLRSTEVVEPKMVFDLIDSMPMRQQEMKRPAAP